MHKYRFPILCVLLVLCIALLIAAIIFWVRSPDSANTYVSWNMTAYLITADGTVQQSFPITIQGNIQDDKENEYAVTLNLDIEVPQDFRYSFVDESVKYAFKGDLTTATHPDDIRAPVSNYDSEANKPAFGQSFINTELRYFMAHWPDTDLYLVASDSGVDPADVLEHFKPYREIYCKPSEQ